MVTKDFKGRLKILSITVMVVIFILIARLGFLQVYDGEYYAGLADGNRIRLIPSMAPRGIFYDRNGNLLVSNRPGFTVSLLPLTAPISEDVIDRLSTLLKVDKTEIHKKIDQHSGFDPIRIKTDIGPEVLTIIEEQKEAYPGVVIEVQPIRNYINMDMAAHVFGYVSEINDDQLAKRKDEGYRSGDIVGQFGLEKVYDKELRGTDGGEQVEVDVTGKPVQILGRKEPIPGANLTLTIDEKIQKVAEKAIDEQLVKIHAKAAAAVVLNPKTGEVLAMVSRPAFNPNLFARGISSKDWKQINDNPNFPLDNKAITGEYPPGSPFKIITGTAALSEGKVGPHEMIFDSGRHWIIPKVNAEGEALGWIDFKMALAHSDNVYFYEMGNRLGIDKLEKYGRMFGLGAKTGINLPYESDGLVANRAYKRKVFNDDWYLSETFDAAIGQGFNLVTPLQIAVVMSEIANGGIRYKPYLVKQITDPNGQVLKDFKPEELGRLDVSPDIIALVQDGLRDVTTIGTAASAFGKDFPVKIAGKTGTAENSQGKDHGWFLAYGPFDDPNIVVAVLVEQGGFGAQSAVPIGKKILEAAFGLVDPEDAAQEAAQK